MTPVARRRNRLLITAEHASDRVPPDHRHLFAGRAARRALANHRGFDPGSRTLARALARRLGAPLIEAAVTRLLVDANRSPDNRAVFSEFSRTLSADERALLLQRHHRPHRARVERAAADLATRGTCVHLAVHTFTPVWKGRRRPIDVAFLYDPRRPLEVALVNGLVARLARAEPALRLRRNAPYRGTSDGLTTALRRRLGPRVYAGIEIEVSQALAAGDAADRRRVTRLLGDALLDLTGGDA